MLLIVIKECGALWTGYVVTPVLLEMILHDFLKPHNRNELSVSVSSPADDVRAEGAHQP